MLERLVTNIGRKITTATLVGILLLGPGCATYKTMSPSLIQPITPTERSIERSIDYSKLTWQEAIEYVKTPEQAQDYLDTHFINDGQVFSKAESFALNHTDRRGDCIDYAIAAATLLSDDGYPPNFLDLVPDNGDLHAVYLYRTNTGYGALGNAPIEPIFTSIQSLVHGIEDKYGWKFDKFKLVDLNGTFLNKEYIDGTKNLDLPTFFFNDYNSVR